MRREMKTVWRLAPLALACSMAAQAAPSKFDPRLSATLNRDGVADAMVELDTAPLPLLRDPNADYLTRRRTGVAMLRTQAAAEQADLVAWLEKRHIAYRAFWISNSIRVHADAATLREIAARGEVRHLLSDAPYRIALPRPEAASLALPQHVETVATGVAKIRAPLAWALGDTGQGVVIAGQDTGYDWTHSALKDKYRGWDGTVASHAYNWHDAIHDNTISGGTNPCSYNTAEPCDDNDHGTHTMGTMLGDDGGTNQVGVAPGAKWIGCRNMDSGNGRPSTYTECMEWLVAPYDTDPNAGDTDKAPDVISNSWGCPAAAPPTGEGCSGSDNLQLVVENVVNVAGIFFAAAAGNDGSACATIFDPPAIFDASFVVGSTTVADAMSSFSSRGPVTGLLTNKPDAVAPGSNIRSSLPGNAYGSLSGTSMATPHVAGTAALVMSINPALKGHPDQVGDILRSTAVHIGSTQVCGSVAATTFPNPVQGYGRIDAYAAVIKADTLFKHDFEQ